MAELQNYILTYYQQIKDGRITVGKWVEMVYQRVVDGLNSKEYYYDAKKAHHVIDWIEAHCFHTEGDLAPNSLKLELWQKAFLSVVFGVVDDIGNRHFREILLVIGRKNGKSLLGAAIARYIWCTDGFGTRVYNIAPKLDQAEIIYNSIWTMTMLDPEWQEKNRLNHERDSSRRKINEEDPTQERHRMTDLYIPATNSTVKKIAMSTRKSDGFNPSATFCDEIASWEGDKGLKQYEVLKSGMGARSQSLLISMTTSGYINDSIYDELVKRSTRFLLGESKEKRLFPLLYMIDDLEKWNDINELRKSNPNLGVSVRVDYLLEEIAIAEGSLSKRSEFLTKYCCIKQNSSVAWLRSEDVQKCVGDHFDLEDFRGCYCVGGIDLSRTTDLTACCIVVEKNKELFVIAKFFLPKEKIDEASARDGLPYRAWVTRGLLVESGDNFVDYEDCLNWFKNLVEEYEILPLKVGYDRYNAQILTKQMQEFGFHMDDVFQGENLSPIIGQLEGLIKDGKVHIGDNDLLKVHLLDSAVKQNAETMRRRLIKVSGNVHIDGTAALLDAMTMRDKWGYEISAQLANEE